MRWLCWVALLAGCDLYFQNGSTPPDCGFQLCHGSSCTYVPCVDAGVDCASDGDCPMAAGGGTAYHCDTTAGVCRANASCGVSSPCDAGQYCDPDAHLCITTCRCSSYAQAQAQGYPWCDGELVACRPAIAASGTCETRYALQCAKPPPTCPVGEVPTVGPDFCWTGRCRTYAQCDMQPECEYINDEADCAAQGCRVETNIHTGQFGKCS